MMGEEKILWDEDYATAYWIARRSAIRKAAERVEERFLVFGRTNMPWAWTALEKAIRDLMRLVRGEQPSEGESDV